MNITPIGIMKNTRTINHTKNKTASNIFLKNSGVDSVSFSGKKLIQMNQDMSLKQEKMQDQLKVEKVNSMKSLLPYWPD